MYVEGEEVSHRAKNVDMLGEKRMILIDWFLIDLITSITHCPTTTTDVPPPRQHKINHIISRLQMRGFLHLLYVRKMFRLRHSNTLRPGHGPHFFFSPHRRPAAHNIHVEEMKPPPYNIRKHYHSDYVSTAKIESHVLTSCAMVAIESEGHVWCFLMYENSIM